MNFNGVATMFLLPNKFFSTLFTYTLSFMNVTDVAFMVFMNYECWVTLFTLVLFS